MLDLVVPNHAPWTGTRLPALYGGGRCLACGGSTNLLITIQDPLFVHGGYGEAVRLTSSCCEVCGWSSVLSRETVRPPRRRT